jgi:general nucleoside transport system permease protein
MPFRLEHRSEATLWTRLVSPLAAVALTLLFGAAIFAALGKDPLQALYVYFIEPLAGGWGVQEVLVKATPLVLIAIGLSLCFRANVWNIGAEGQYTIGAIAGSGVALTFGSVDTVFVLPAMLLAAMLAGAAYGLIPAVLKNRFGANEILTSLMLVYVAQYLLDYLVRGPWRDPAGFNFPQTETFSAAATMPLLADGGRLHAGAILALMAVLFAAVLLGRTMKGFEIKVMGAAPRAGAFGGFRLDWVVLFTFAISGALAGLAGIGEVAGPIGQLVPTISPGYGFTAIIVAFLGRLDPVGILFAGLLLALTYIGGENAQIAMEIPIDLTRVFQGMLLFFVLACDALSAYRLVRIDAQPASAAAAE